MKNILFQLVFSLVSLPAYCQVVAIQNDKQNILYQGIPNPLTVAIEKQSTASIDLTTNNGQIIKAENGHYIITPDKTGQLIISVFRHNLWKTKFICSSTFRVKQIPLEVMLMGHTGGEIDALLVYRSIAPSAIVYGLDMDAKEPIIRFTVIVKRKGEDIFKRSLQNPDGTRFDSTTKSFFKTFQNGDQFIITGIVCKEPDNSERPIEGMEFTIVNAEGLKEIGKRRTVTITDPITNTERVITTDE